MAVLTDEQLQNGYFRGIGGFPPAKRICTVAEYDGSEECCIVCTQLQGRFSEREGKQILKDWIWFLEHEPTAFRALHFNSRVPQALFNAACRQKKLKELRFKWGSYPDLTALSDLSELQFLYLGSCPSVQDITPVTHLRELVVLYLENFKKIEDYSSLTKLPKLEQLVISGPELGTTPVKDLDFLCEMPGLASVWLPNVKLSKRYSDEERQQLRENTAHIQGVYNQQWWR